MPFINNLGAISHLIDGYITTNGACCTIGDRTVRLTPIARPDTDRLLEFVRNERTGCVVMCNEGTAMLNKTPDTDHVLYDILNIRYDDMAMPLDEILQRPVLQITPFITREQEDFVQAATVHQAMDAMFPRPLQPLLRDAARRISYVRDIMPRITCYPGLHDVLDFCRERGVRLAMNTNRTDGMDMLLDNCRLHGYFDPIVLASHVARPKPAPDGALLIMKTWNIPAARLLFIGDSTSDKGAAEGAGIPFLAFQTEGLSPVSTKDFPTLLQALKSLPL